MDLQVKYNKVKNQKEAYEVAKNEITQEYISKWNIPCDVSYDEGKCLVNAKGKGFSLVISFDDQAANVKLELSFLFKAFKKTVLEKIEHKLQKHM